jgi:hypothetical protein
VLDTPGAQSMTVARRYVESGEWWKLRPAQDLLAAQPGAEDAQRFVAAARTGSGDWAVVYLPAGESREPIHLKHEAVAGASSRWFDPRSGHWSAAHAVTGAEGRASFVAPDAGDWVLDLRR